jgi:hypothetical protein
MQVFVETHIPRGSADGMQRLVDSVGNVIAVFDDDVTEEVAESIAECVNRGNAGPIPVDARMKGQPRQTVRVFMEGGVIHDMHVPRGITVFVRDCDVEGVEPERIQRDENGHEFVESVWESDT